MAREQMYRNRNEAGRELAPLLEHYRKQRPVILALPRGGVPVARPIAEHLQAPVDVLLVRKLGVPGHEEYAMGAIAEAGQRVMNQDVVTQLRIDAEVIEGVAAREREELQRRGRAYRGNREPEPVKGRTAILVDDGLATGATMRAAAQAVAQRDPERVVIAVPVGAPDVVACMRDVADEVVCPLQPQMLGAVGRWYADFSQVSDEDVRKTLAALESFRRADPDT